MADAVVTIERGALPARPARRFGTSWVGLLPFFTFSFAFIVMPTAYLVLGSLEKNDRPSLQNYADLGTGVIPLSLLTSIEVSLVTAVAGGILGFLLAYAIILGGLPRFLRTAVMTFSGVASNFAGVPLALAFTFTLGQLGVLTTLLKDTFGFSLYDNDFRLSGKFGLELVYLY